MLLLLRLLGPSHPQYRFVQVIPAALIANVVMRVRSVEVAIARAPCQTRPVACAHLSVLVVAAVHTGDGD